MHSWETKTLGTSYSETTYLLDLKLWQQGELMSTPCCQISTAYRLVPGVPQKTPQTSGIVVGLADKLTEVCGVFCGTPGRNPYIVGAHT